MSFVRRLAIDAAIAAVYFVVAAATIASTRFDGGVAFLWVASPILIAVLAARPRRQWPRLLVLCALSSVVATGTTGLGWALAAPFALANMVEAYVAAYLLRRARYRSNELGSVSWLIHFVACVGVAAPLASGMIAALSLGVAGFPVLQATTQFVTGHALANITLVPIFSLLIGGGLAWSMRLTSARRVVEAVVLLSLVAVTTALVFWQPTPTLLFLPMLPIILTTFRIGQGGAAVSVCLLALIGGGGTMAGLGPIWSMQVDTGQALQFFQFYLAATVLTVLPVAADLSRRGRLHRELRISEERYRLLAEHSTDIVMHLERDGRIRFVSPSIRQIGGYDPADLVGRNAEVLVAPECLARAREAHVQTILAEGATHSIDFEAVTALGDRRWFEMHSRAVIDDDGELDGVLSFIRDVTARKATELRLRQAALTDPLTDLPNRAAFRDLAHRRVPAPGEAERDAVAILDVDHFKAVNDRYGHDAGDQVLKEFARVARSIVRPGDMVARIGGEEFGLFLPDTDSDQAVAICERLRTAMAAHDTMVVAGVAIGVTVSGGVAVLGADGLDASLKRADEALYAAKRQGRDRMALAA